MDVNKDLKYMSDENICDSDGISSDSGFSDHSGEYDTHILTECHTEELSDTTVIHHVREGGGDKRKIGKKKTKKLRGKKCWSWSKILMFLIFFTFSLTTSLIIFHIRCFNNICAIYIPPYITYNNYNPGRHII